MTGAENRKQLRFAVPFITYENYYYYNHIIFHSKHSTALFFFKIIVLTNIYLLILLKENKLRLKCTVWGRAVKQSFIYMSQPV